MRLRAATNTDGYKIGHGQMYIDGTEVVYSNLTPRTDKIYRRNCTPFYDGMLVVVGQQGAIQEVQEMWNDTFFDVDKEEAIGRYASRLDGYLGGYAPAVKALTDLWDLGYLPLEFKALEEGSKVHMGVPIMTIRNTLPEFFWLVNYLESLLSNLVWKSATNATIAAEYKAICEHYAKLTGTDDFTVSVQCHDFSQRGMSGPEDAARSGFSHLTQFIGTDTLPAMDYAEDYYDADPDGLIAISVPATEHAVATSNILAIDDELTCKYEIDDADTRLQSELVFMRDLITRKFPTGIISYVADSFDFWAVLTNILPALKDVILAREASNVAPGKLVIRPDSGDPVKVICGLDESQYRRTCDGVAYPLEAWDGAAFKGGYAPIPEHEVKGAIQVLWEIFGGTITETGHKLLDSHIGLIYGDSITTKRAEEILRRLADKGFASGNVVFGVGSFTYQCNTRDTFGFAVKATYTKVDGQGIDIFKDPKTDSKKKSAKGLLFVGEDGTLTDQVSLDKEASEDNNLKTIWKDGEWVKRTTLDEIRGRLAK